MCGPIRRHPPLHILSAVMLASRSGSVTIDAPLTPRSEEILTPAALAFVAGLHRAFDARRRALLARRVERRRALAAHPIGAPLDFPADTAHSRAADWRVAPAPADL